jgi:deazaflavin-dependent oxidoreductase (nitroreductase family)
VSDWNANIIEEFRGNEGRIGGHFEGWPLLLLHHTGAKTGTERVNPLAYQAVDGGYAVFASKSGATDNPDWYHNLVATHASPTGTSTTASGQNRSRIAPTSPSTRRRQIERSRWSCWSRPVAISH